MQMILIFVIIYYIQWPIGRSYDFRSMRSMETSILLRILVTHILIMLCFVFFFLYMTNLFVFYWFHVIHVNTHQIVHRSKQYSLLLQVNQDWKLCISSFEEPYHTHEKKMASNSWQGSVINKFMCEFRTPFIYQKLLDVKAKPHIHIPYITHRINFISNIVCISFAWHR